MLLTFVVSCHALKMPVAVNLGRLCPVSVRGHLGWCCADVTLKGACESIPSRVQAAQALLHGNRHAGCHCSVFAGKRVA